MAQAQKKEEKKSGLPPITLRAGQDAANFGSSWFGGGSGGGLFGNGGLFGANGAFSGWTAGLAGVGGKVAVALLLATLGVGAFGVGKMISPHEVEPNASQRIGVERITKPIGDDLAKLPGNAGGQSAMQIIPESFDGKTDAQRAAEEAARQDAERKAREAAEAAAKPPEPSFKSITEAIPPVLPAEQPAATKKGSFTQKFGELSKFGAGHAGLTGGAGMANGLNGFSDKHLQNGDPKGFGTNSKAVTRMAARSSPHLASHSRSFAFRQLDRANGLSRAGASSTGETGSMYADSAFSNSRISGGAITGGGAGSTPITGAGVTQGGPTEANQKSDGTKNPEDPQHKDSSQWKQIAMMGAGALAGAGMMLMMASQTISKGKKARKAAQAELAAAQAQPAPANAAAIAKAQAALAAAEEMVQQGKMMAMLAAALGAAGIGVGFLLWKKFKQKQYGMIFMAGGGMIIALAMALMMEQDKEDPKGEVTKGVDGNTASAGETVAGNSAAPGKVLHP